MRHSSPTDHPREEDTASRLKVDWFWYIPKKKYAHIAIPVRPNMFQNLHILLTANAFRQLKAIVYNKLRKYAGHTLEVDVDESASVLEFKVKRYILIQMFYLNLVLH